MSCGGADEVVVIDIDQALALIQKTPAEKRGQLRSRLSLSPQFLTQAHFRRTQSLWTRHVTGRPSRVGVQPSWELGVGD